MGIELTLKIKPTKYILDRENGRNDIEYVNSVDDGEYHYVKLSTNKLEINRDPQDNRNINQIKNIKMIYELENGGCLILFGNLGCSYSGSYGGEFYVTRAIIDQKCDYEKVQGVKLRCAFSNNPMKNSMLRCVFNELINDPNFEYNFNQFEEFMDLFKYYKSISNELNNNATYSIKSLSDVIYFLPIEEKSIEVDKNETIKDAKGVIIGYRIPKHKYKMLSSEEQECVRELLELTIVGEDKEIKKIRSFADNLYLSNNDKIDEFQIKQLCVFDIVNIMKGEKDKSIKLLGELSKKGTYSYLHLYDMGQKVKLESIDNSLQLIQQGASGAASEMLEYIIGSKPMPSNTEERQKNIFVKKRYMADLDSSQRDAFLMATDNSPVSLIKGPPGTGKTHVINAIVQYITKELHQRVVISSQTHVAIDNVLDKLMSNYDLVIPNRITNRINQYAGERIDDTLYKTWGKNIRENSKRVHNQKLADQVLQDIEFFKGSNKINYSTETQPSEYSVIGATTTTSAIGGKKGLELLEGFDWLIIDEVSKCPITEVLRYLPYVQKIIMVGDDFQLAPVLEFTKEEVIDLDCFDEDKFSKLKSIYEESVFFKNFGKSQKNWSTSNAECKLSVNS